jgi:xylulokinase
VCAQVDVRRLAGLSISHQRESFVPVDAALRPLRNAIPWMDARCRDLLPELEGRLGAEHFHQLTGRPLSSNLVVGKIEWLRRVEPEAYAGTRCYLDTHAFLVHRLTGELVTGWGSADPTGLYDTAGRRWADDVLAAIGVSAAQLPALAPPGATIGSVTLEAAARCGLPAGLPVICGLGDGQAAGLGAGITEPGRAYLNLGTAVVSGTFSAQYLADKAFRTTCGGVAGTYVLETVLLGGTYTVSWFAERIVEGQPDATAAAMESAAAALPPGSDGLMLVPYWSGALNPYWDAAASGIVIGWRGQHGRPHLFRAILEGIAFEQRLHTEGVETATGQPVTGYVVMGGGSRSALWRRIIADVTGKPVRRCASPEASALGAAMLAAAGIGLHTNARAAAAAMSRIEESPLLPDPERQAVYSRLYEEVYRGLFPVLQPSLHTLAKLTAKGAND